jgi:hypothetical protein
MFPRGRHFWGHGTGRVEASDSVLNRHRDLGSSRMPDSLKSRKAKDLKRQRLHSDSQALAGAEDYAGRLESPGAEAA